MLNESYDTHFFVNFFQYHVENDIDGETLLMLIDDFDEFRTLVDAPIARLKMKKFVKQRLGNAAENGHSKKVCTCT